ncbi:cell division protein FtsX [Thermoflavifilum thermophilum]|uniref:Cell division protein FtsX n=1 Tax=Thermoflavifilum thermophilum TaxID=1393122 RepID=A0A1I7N535_9BACT|nr:permease-like cell division protein FtsX [Thermoflavifilum thermophilum]SFV29787.1 cell division transport system permease protein [Thermoflavifilum thermophilum]
MLVAKAGTRRARPSYLMSIIGVALVLFFLGIVGLLFINTRQLTSYFKENIEVQVILRDDVQQATAQALRDSLAQLPFVKSIEYVSKEEAYRRYVQETHDSAQALLGYNPLYASINFKARAAYVNADSLQQISRQLQQLPEVREVFYQQGLVDQLNENMQRIGLVFLALSILLALVVIVLIDNTIRLAMFSNRFLIKTMQMVGATRWFIAKPFDKKSIWNGFISALIAILGICIVIYAAEQILPELRALQNNLQLAILFAGLIAVGILISLISTHRAVMKYLRTRVDDLY